MDSDSITDATLQPPSARERLEQAVAQKLTDVLVPGFAATFDPDEAEFAGAFDDDAIDAADAAAAPPEFEE